LATSKIEQELLAIGFDFTIASHKFLWEIDLEVIDLRYESQIKAAYRKRGTVLLRD